MYLMHHGIKGMRWGIRRYQNPDGTLTDAGRKRYKKALYNISGEFDIESQTSEIEKTGIIPKGTEAYRTSYSDNENPLSSERKYVSFSTEGAMEYTNPDMLVTDATMWETQKRGFVYIAKRDLRVATTKDVEEYLASKSKYPERAKKLIEDLHYVEIPSNRVQNRAAKTKAEKEAQKWTDKASYWYRQQLASGNLFNTKYDETNPVFDHFRKLGFDAISDLEDGGIGGNLGAAIVLDPKSSFTAKVYDDDDYYEYVLDQDRKHWKN